MYRRVGRHQQGGGQNNVGPDSSEDMSEYSSEYTSLEDEERVPVLTAGTAGTADSEPERSDRWDNEAFEVTREEYEDFEPKPRGKRKRSRFGRFLLIYSAVFLALIVVGLFVFWKYIAAFEASRPEHAMEKFVLSLSDAKGADTLENIFTVSEFENKDTVFGEFSKTYLQGQEYTFKKMAGEYTDNAPVYVLRAGTADVLKVYLKPSSGERAGFGFKLWDISKAMPAQGCTRTLTIEAPPDISVSVNGIAVAKSYITDDHAEYENQTEQQKRFVTDTAGYRIIYTVSGIFDEATVSAKDSQGTEVKATFSDGSRFEYDTARYSTEITGPSDAVITVNGIKLTDKDSAEALFPKKLFTGLKKYAAAPDMVTYKIEGLFSKPEIAAKDASGNELKAYDSFDGETMVGLKNYDKLKTAHLQLASDFVKAYVSFSTNEGKNTNGNFARLSKYLLKDTDTYKRMKDSMDGISWVTGGTIKYRELTADDFFDCGENCFACRVKLGITVTAAGNVRDTDSVYTLVFVRSGDSWLVGNMLAS